MLKRLLWSAAIVGATAAPAAAQAPAAPGGGWPVRVGGFVLFDSNALAAERTFDATMGTSTFRAAGGGVDVQQIWKGVFARVAFSSMTETGTRVSVINGQVLSNNIPHTVKMRPVELAAGWRLTPRAAAGRLAIYGGAGFLFLNYEERSDFASADENTTAQYTGRVVFGGADVAVWRWVRAGVEAQYRGVPKSLGTQDRSVSKAFGETDLGGATFRILVAAGFGK